MSKKLRVYLDTSVLNFYYADDTPDKRDVTIAFFREIENDVYKEIEIGTPEEVL